MKYYVLSLLLIPILFCFGCTITDEFTSEPESGTITGGTIIPNTTALLRVSLNDDSPNSQSSRLAINTVLTLYNSVNTSEVFAVTTIDSAGGFTFADVPFGTYDIVSTSNGFGALFQNITLTSNAPEYYVESLEYYSLVSMYIYTGDRNIQTIAYYSELLEKDSTKQYVFDAIDFPSSMVNVPVQKLNVRESNIDTMVDYTIAISTDSSYINVYRVGDKTVLADSVYQDSLFNDSLFLDSLYGDSIMVDTFLLDSLYLDSLYKDSLKNNTANGGVKSNPVLDRLSKVLVGNYNRTQFGEDKPLLSQSLIDSVYNDLELLYQNEQSFRIMIDSYRFSLIGEHIDSSVVLRYPGTDTLAMMNDPGVIYLMNDLGASYDSVYVDNIELIGYDGALTVYFTAPGLVLVDGVSARYDSLKGDPESGIERVHIEDYPGDDRVEINYSVSQRAYQLEKIIRTGSCGFVFDEVNECTITKQYWEFVVESGGDTYQKYELGTSPCLLGKLDTACTRGSNNIEFYSVAETFSDIQYSGYNQFRMLYDGWNYAEHPFLTVEDIVFYDSSSATLEITSEASAAMPNDALNMFVVVVDGAAAFWGVHWSDVFSSTTDAVVMYPLDSNKIRFTLEFGYPQDSGHYMSPLKNSEFLLRLEEGGKLK